MKCTADPRGNDKDGNCGECPFVGNENDCPTFEQLTVIKKVVLFFRNLTKG